GIDSVVRGGAIKRREAKTVVSSVRYSLIAKRRMCADRSGASPPTHTARPDLERRFRAVAEVDRVLLCPHIVWPDRDVLDLQGDWSRGARELCVPAEPYRLIAAPRPGSRCRRSDQNAINVDMANGV